MILVLVGASVIQTYTLYYFVFEMKKVEDLVRSENFEEHLRKAKATRQAKIIVTLLFLGIYLPFTFAVYIAD